MGRFKDIEDRYKKGQRIWKSHIRQEPSRFKRFWEWVWYAIAFPWKWLWVNVRDWRTALIFATVVATVSSEVWVPYLIGLIGYRNESLRMAMFSVGSACWLFWLGPGTPFMVICIGLTMAIKGLFNRIRDRKHEKE
jgi:hypothetical protein